MAIKTATVINKEKDSVTTTISIDDIISKIADTMHIAKSYAWSALQYELQRLEFPWCKIIEFPELCYQYAKIAIPNMKSSSQQKILIDVAKVIIIQELLICMDSHRYLQSFFLINSKNKVDFLNQIGALEKELKHLLNVYKGPFLSICNRHDKGEINLKQRDLSACKYFLSILKETSKYDIASMPDVNLFCSSIMTPLLSLSKKDFKKYDSYLMSDYISDLIKNNAALASFLNGLYKMEEEELGNYNEQVKVLLIQVFLATCKKKNTNLKGDALKKFILYLISKTRKAYHNDLQYIMGAYNI